jgi:hypothetical protein
MSVPVYFSTMRGYVDEMAAAGKALDNDDIVFYILNGLEADYNSLIAHVNGMTDPISPETLYTPVSLTLKHVWWRRRDREIKRSSIICLQMPLHVVALVATSSRLVVVTKGLVVALAATMEATIILVTLPIPIVIINGRSMGS